MNEVTDIELKEFDLAKGEDLLPKNFPRLENVSAAFMFNFVPKPSQTLLPEFVYVPIDVNERWGENGSIKTELTITEWNCLWEAGHLRSEFVPHQECKSVFDSQWSQERIRCIRASLSPLALAYARKVRPARTETRTLASLDVQIYHRSTYYR